MGITLMDNFDVADNATLTANNRYLLELALNGAWGVFPFTEQGITRTCLRCYNDFNQGGQGASPGSALGIPIPLPPAGGVNKDREYYVSFRLRIVTGSSLAAMTPVTTAPHFPYNLMYIALSAWPATGLGQPYNIFNIMRGDALTGGDPNKLWMSAGPAANATVPSKTLFVPGADGWFHVEVYKPKGDMTFTVWLNDFMYKASAATTDGGAINANTNYLRLFMGRAGSWAGYRYGYEITDLIVIDPSTDGQKYRFGSTGRVLSMNYTSDIVNEWAADPAATLSHRQMMMIDKSVPDATNILTSTQVGQREQYGMMTIPAAYGPYVPVVAVKPRVMNAGAATHSLALEIDWGQGITEIGEKSIAPGGSYDTTPVIMTTKPNGDPWTTADFANAKAGFSVKS